jgi:hypothetical protein
MIPGSLCEVAKEREAEADRAVRLITEELWDAPILVGGVYANVWSHLKHVAGQDGRDDYDTIMNFLRTHRGQMVIPVWM